MVRFVKEKRRRSEHAEESASYRNEGSGFGEAGSPANLNESGS